ncbi:MAG TPA: hypothetical protein PLU81_11955, partial [Deltaproteobacteria bacterium]|nr:hypothetical protein [Deltaproteobacteria bacterium]HPR52496.1 hypothetical protein [Deltaproteobacteria bacterium]
PILPRVEYPLPPGGPAHKFTRYNSYPEYISFPSLYARPAWILTPNLDFFPVRQHSMFSRLIPIDNLQPG